MQLSWQLGYLTARNEALLEQLATLRPFSPAPTPTASPWTWLRGAVERAELAQRGIGVLAGAWRLWRSAPWGWLVTGLFGLGKWLGVL